MNICVFCSAQKVPEKYNDAAREFAALIGKHGHALVWGGSEAGTMKVVADAAQEAGAKLLGVSVEFLKEKARKNADEMRFAADLRQRKAWMSERADAIVALPGGLGTLDETAEILALRRHNAHQKPVVFLNTDEFYAGMKLQLQTMEREGFLGNVDGDVVEGLDSVAHFADTPEEVMEYIAKHAIS